MDFLLKNLSPELVFSLGLMLLHMLWQGLIIAVILGTFLIAMRKSSAQSRYTIAVISIFLFPITSIITFFKIFSNIKIQQELITTQPDFLNTMGEGSGLLNSFLDIYMQYLPVVVFIWFIGMTILLLRYLGLLIYVERLKNYLVKPVTDKLKNKIDNISKQFSIRKNIRSLISLKVASPMVIGHFKPVLLIPKLALDNLTDEEMDVVLHHELAHIRRNDYLLNVYQNIVEIIFFFHPGMWWVSSIIRKEREECCDVFAVKDEQDKIILANALTTIHEINHKIPNMALSLLNNRNGLLNRISNLFGKPGMATFKEGLVVAFFFFFSIGLMSFMVSENNSVKKQKEELKTISGELSSGEHLFAKVDSSGVIQKLFVEGKRMGNKKMKYYQSDVDSLIYNEKLNKWLHKNEIAATKSKPDVKPEPRTNNKNYDNKYDTKYDNNYDYDDDKIDPEEMREMKKDILEAFKDVNEELGLNINIDEDDSKVSMRADKKGFVMDVADGDNKVEMNFGPEGIYMNVVENGKTVFHMNIDEGTFEFTVDDSSKKNNGSKKNK